VLFERVGRDRKRISITPAPAVEIAAVAEPAE
jgi:hypothetical protein